MKDGKRNFAGDPRAATPSPKIMLRALVVSVAMWVVTLGPCTAETTPPASRVNDSTGNQGSKPSSPNDSNSTAGSSSGEDLAAESELFESANKSRKLAGVPLLRMEESLRAAARAHGQRMVSSEQLEHRFSGEPALLERMALASPLKMDRVGENIAYANCASGVNDTLMHSPPHRQNLLDPRFDIAGIAAFWSKGRLYVVQDFAHQVPSYSARQSQKLVGRAVDDTRQQAGLSALIQLSPPSLDQAACSLARENRPNAHLLATAYENRKIITYTQSQPDVLPPGSLRMLRDPGIREFAVGSCYARNAAYPTGIYWVAILLY